MVFLYPTLPSGGAGEASVARHGETSVGETSVARHGETSVARQQTAQN